MKGALCRLALPLLLLAARPAFGWDRPLKVEPVDGGSQTVMMCPKCSTPIACAKVGDYTLTFAVDLLDPASLGIVRMTVRVTDKAGAPVDATKVSVAPSMTKAGHWHDITPPLTADRKANGAYVVTTSRLMTGIWRTEVSVTTTGGDTVKQRFVFSRP